MGFYAEQVLPRLIDRMCGSSGMVRWRQRTTAGLEGQLVEIGFGTGLNLAYLSTSVTGVYAVEPSATALRLARRRNPDFDARVTHVGLDGGSILLDDESCDAALCTFTLCTVPDPPRALRELHRVLRPGGRFHFLEHGIAPDDATVRWQRRLDPWERRLADGCSLTRDPLALVAGAGFTVEVVRQRYAKGPKPWSYFTLGHATKV
jgi:ubiquinone/menaquinone biosynthesis C-methylase UbiE